MALRIMIGGGLALAGGVTVLAFWSVLKLSNGVSGGI